MTYAFRLNRPLFDELCERSGLETQTETAKRIGVHEVTLSRVLNGRGRPGADFIGRLHHAFPGHRIDDLFQLVPHRQETK